MLPLLWEFPSGRVEDGEADDVALKRELIERLGVEVDVQQLSMFIKHDYDDYVLDFCVYHCLLKTTDIETRRVHDWRWVTPVVDQYSRLPTRKPYRNCWKVAKASLVRGEGSVQVAATTTVPRL